MPKYTSAYPGLLVMPDGSDVRKGQEVEISADLSKNAAVEQWIKDGWLTTGDADKAELESTPPKTAPNTEADDPVARGATGEVAKRGANK